MPRKPRFYVPGVPVHLIQRGNNRQACFFAEEDYRFYLQHLGEAASRYGCALHAYVLMTNHVHLLMTPATSEAVSKVMQSVGRHYVRHINRTYRRTGTLWPLRHFHVPAAFVRPAHQEGRHKASAIDSESYLLICYRYIELNPVRARMVNAPGAYRWSSYRHHAHTQPDPMVEDHALYHALGRTPVERALAYRELFRAHLDPVQLRTIRQAANVGVPLGNNRFKEQIEIALQCKVGHAHRGRPRKPIALESMSAAQKEAR